MNTEAAKLLVIDDDEAALAILRKLLEAEGYEADVCSSGAGALERLAHTAYDAILCDVWMEGMSGKDFYLKLKKDLPEYQRRVIFITGDTSSEATWEFIEERHLPYVIKPINRPLLFSKVREIVGERPAPKTDDDGKSAWDGVYQRRHRRVAINVNVRVRRKKWDVGGPDTAMVINASRGGILFESDREYRAGMEVWVAYPYTGYDDVEEEGVVLRVEELPGGRRGVAIAMGEEAVAAREAFAGSGKGARPHPVPKMPAVVSFAKPSQEEQEARRRSEEFEELKRTHDQVIDKRDRLASEAANLKRKLEEMEPLKKRLEEMEATKTAMSQMVNGLQTRMAGLQKDATHDALTGLLNRAAVLDILKKEMIRAHREGTSVGVLLGDLDHFKNINDTHGHLAGDEVLREAAQRIGAAVRSYDSVGRYGGEEFLIILSGCADNADMVKQADRIRSQVCGGPVRTADGEIPITLSVGAASSSEYAEVEAVLRAADAALYRAKRAGRNRVELACAAEPQSA
ncbi:MAG TPA: diguanylate cyclase [Terriglobia bacterium]